MAKKKQYTFADEAKALQKKFPRRETDPIEREDYKRSMMRLMQEQEMARQEMGLTQPQEQFREGGKIKYPDGGKIYQRNDNFIDKNINYAKGWWEHNKPKLMKDFPITDGLVGPILDYISGEGDASSSTAMLPLPAVGTRPLKTISPDKLPKKVYRGVLGAKGEPVPERLLDVAEHGMPTGGNGIVPTRFVSGKADEVAELYATPSVWDSKGFMGSKNTKAEGLLNEYSVKRPYAAVKSSEADKFIKKMLKKDSYTEFEGAAVLRKHGIDAVVDDIMYKNTDEGLQFLDNDLLKLKKSFKKTPNYSNNTLNPDIRVRKNGGKIKYPYGGNLPTDFATRSAVALGPATPQFNKPVVTPDFNTLPWSYGSNPNQQQYLTPTQLTQTGQPWERPTSPTNSAATGNPGQPTKAPVTPETAVTRDPMLTNTTRMESIGIPKIGNPIAGNPQSLTVEDSGVGANALSGDKKGFFAANKDMLPYAVSGLSNIASNLILANQAGKNIPKITPTIGSPEKINLEPQADMLRSQAGVAKNIAIRNARNLGVNPMEALAGIGAASAGIDRGLGQNLTNLYMGQEQANVGAANQFAMANQQSRERANIFNTQAKNQAKQDQLGYLGAAMSTVPGVMKDIRMDKADQQMRDVMRSYYNSMGRNYMVEGDIFDNPEDGFRYKVRNNELVRVGKNQ